MSSFQIKITNFPTSKYVSKTDDVKEKIDRKKLWGTCTKINEDPHVFHRHHNAKAVADWLNEKLGWKTELVPVN